jgi:hypothetical protein
MIRKVHADKVPVEVKEELDRQMKAYGKWLDTNYCNYYPNKVNFVNDKIVRYMLLANGEYAIIKTYYKS